MALTYVDNLYIQVTLIAIICSLLIFQRIKYKVRPLNWIILTLLLGILRSIVEIVAIFIIGERNIWSPFYAVHFMVYGATIIMIYTYGEYAISLKPLVRRAAIVYSLYGIMTGMLVTSMLMNISSTSNPSFWPLQKSPIPFWEFPFDLLQTFIFAFGSWVFFRMTRFADNKKSKILSLLILSSMILFLVAAILELSEHFTGILIDATLTTMPALLLLIGVYGYNPRFAYSSPLSLHRIVLLHDYGQTIVEEIIGDKYEKGSSEHLLMAGISTTLNSIFKEITDSESDLKLISSESSSLIFAKANRVLAIIEVEKPSKFMKDALDGFTNDFAEQYADELKNFTNDISVFSDYHKIFHRYFPYLKK